MDPMELVLAKLAGDLGGTDSQDENYPAEWYDRTTDFLKAEILSALADKRNILGPHNAGKPRMQLLIKAQLSDPAFDQALEAVATKILEIFPNRN